MLPPLVVAKSGVELGLLPGMANRFYRAIYRDGDNSIDVYKRMVESLPANKDAGQARIRAEIADNRQNSGV